MEQALEISNIKYVNHMHLQCVHTPESATVSSKKKKKKEKKKKRKQQQQQQNTNRQLHMQTVKVHLI